MVTLTAVRFCACRPSIMLFSLPEAVFPSPYPYPLLNQTVFGLPLSLSLRFIFPRKLSLIAFFHLIFPPFPKVGLGVYTL